jgi:hypothetical protein
MIILLSDNDITKNTPLGGNIDTDKLRQCIIDAQATRLEELLGETLYFKIETDFDNDDLSGQYLTLYDSYIKPFLIQQSATEYLKIGAFSFANNGITMPTPANTTAVSETTLARLINERRIVADMYADRMKRWLCKNMLPEYASSSDNIVNPQRASNSGWYLPDYQPLTVDELILWKTRERRI